jgi:hypothetical protein
MSTAAFAGRRPGIERWAGLGGVAYVVLFIVGTLVAFGGSPNGDAAPAEVIAYYRDSGHRDKMGLGWLLIVLGVFFFLWFLSALRQIVRRTDGDGFLTGLVTVGGAVYATTTLVGISLDNAIRTMSDDTFRDQVYPSLIHAAGDAGYVIHASGGIGLGALMVAASLAAMRAALIPAWAGWTGVVFGVIALFSVFFFPLFAIVIWLLAASVLVYLAPVGPAPAAPVTA